MLPKSRRDEMWVADAQKIESIASIFEGYNYAQYCAKPYAAVAIFLCHKKYEANNMPIKISIKKTLG